MSERSETLLRTCQQSVTSRPANSILAKTLGSRKASLAIIGLFAGIGGFEEGFRRAGHHASFPGCARVCSAADIRAGACLRTDQGLVGASYLGNGELPKGQVGDITACRRKAVSRSLKITACASAR